MREKIIKFLEENFEPKIDFYKLLKKSNLSEYGDFSLPVFELSKKLKKSPDEIAKSFEKKLSKSLPKQIKKIVAKGGYLNFYLDNLLLTDEIIKKVNSEEMFNPKIPKKEKIMIEYPSPNTNKSLHIGHVRNILLGNSLSRILKKVGHIVIITTLYNDRGIAISKAMLGYKLFFSKATPQSLNMKSDEFVGMCYFEFEKKIDAEKKQSEGHSKLEEQAQKMLVKWESGDKKARELWTKILDWVYDGYAITFHDLKLEKPDKSYFESQIYDKGKEIIVDALKRKIKGFKKDKNKSILCDFENKTHGKKYLLRGDGTTLYMTTDLYLAKIKSDEFDCDKYIFVVGREQQHHFEILFELLDRIGITKSKENYHYSYGYVFNENGEKFSSRKGRTISADNLLKMMQNRAKENLVLKEITKDLSQTELNRRANIIGYGAMTFTVLNTNPMLDIKFDIDKALDFTGETGPYLQYTYARINSVLKKAKFKSKNIDFSIYTEKEISLIKKLGEYSDVLIDAADKLKPSLIANYLIKLAQSYNEFYQNTPILKSSEKEKLARLELSYLVARTLEEGLELLNIDTLDEM